MFKKLSGILSVTLLAAGCGTSDTETTAHLQPLQGCVEVETAIRQAALQQMNETLDKALDSALKYGPCGGHYNRGEDLAASPSAAAGSGSTSGGAKQASGTNNQVAGVEEADFIKNDNKYIYVVSGNQFRIIDAYPVAGSKQLAKVTIEGTPKKLFVTKNRALIYSSLGTSSSTSSSSECTYGYSCSFTGDGNPSLLTIMDITDRTAPKKVREIRLSGSYVNSRRVGSAVYVVLSSPGVKFTGLSYSPDGLSNCGTSLTPWQVIEAFEELRAKNAKIILDTPLKDFVPSVEDKIKSGPRKGTTSQILGACKGFYRSAQGDGDQFTTLLGLSMTEEQPLSSSTIVSRPGAIFASAKALYISVTHQRSSASSWQREDLSGASEVSTVHKFVLDAKLAAARYAASGAVKGHVLNQFSMDEENDYLRIATSNGSVPSSNVHSTVTVLKQQASDLVQVGVVDNLAPKEDIRSVRFNGSRCFMVTFKKTDPLFVIDLTSPESPRVLGELKIPGFSTYMHMMDSKHLLTIGYDASDQGSFAWFTGVLLQIFDISDPKSPKLVHKEVIGTRGSSSEALNNHLAFNYFAVKNLLALPMTICESSSGNGSYGNQLTFSGLVVYDVTAKAGFKLRGKVSHPAGQGITCSNWWTSAKSQVKRSIIMDDYVFSVSSELIKVNHLNNLPTDVKSFSLTD